MIFKSIYSPNQTRKARHKKDIKVIVIHYTGMQSRIESLKRLTNQRFKVSCHYFIDRKGKILRIVDDNKIAWHAGKSKWKNFSNLNKNSIGIELVNKGHRFGYEKFSKIQIKKLIKLLLFLKRKYKIQNTNIVGHSDIAPFRKKDPGEKFPWKMLKQQQQLGIWFKLTKFNLKKNKEKNKRELFFKNLFKIGYRYFNIKKNGNKDHLVVEAFQRRFIQSKISGKIDQKTYEISHNLADKC
ncbi:MAG: N-acetylmuramoyl-L-alanine amidase [Pelagibacteraceae bacterium]